MIIARTAARSPTIWFLLITSIGIPPSLARPNEFREREYSISIADGSSTRISRSRVNSGAASLNIIDLLTRDRVRLGFCCHGVAQVLAGVVLHVNIGAVESMAG